MTTTLTPFLESEARMLATRKDFEAAKARQEQNVLDYEAEGHKRAADDIRRVIQRALELRAGAASGEG